MKKRLPRKFPLLLKCLEQLDERILSLDNHLLILLEILGIGVIKVEVIHIWRGMIGEVEFDKPL